VTATAPEIREALEVSVLPQVVIPTALETREVTATAPETREVTATAPETREVRARASEASSDRRPRTFSARATLAAATTTTRCSSTSTGPVRLLQMIYL
jgi:hypothetical protein